MKCAMEAVMQSNEIRQEKELQTLRGIVKEKESLVPNAVRYVHSVIAPMIDKLVANGEPIRLRLPFGKAMSQYTFEYFMAPVETDGNVYANGTLSESPNPKWILDLNTLRKELAKFCYTTSESKYLYQRYRSGWQTGVELLIEPDPACIK